jgi:hypothetical protein
MLWCRSRKKPNPFVGDGDTARCGSVSGFGFGDSGSDTYKFKLRQLKQFFKISQLNFLAQLTFMSTVRGHEFLGHYIRV